jgi:hypothetical protein
MATQAIGERPVSTADGKNGKKGDTSLFRADEKCEFS